MKKLLLISFISFAFTNCASAPRNTAQEPRLRSFSTDYCSAYREGPRDNPNQWSQCCVIHDVRYWRGGTWEERIAADHELEKCVADTGAEKESRRMFLGVRIGGGALWATSYHWGYGWKHVRGYDRLTERERADMEEVWKEPENDIASLPEFLVDID